MTHSAMSMCVCVCAHISMQECESTKTEDGIGHCDQRHAHRLTQREYVVQECVSMCFRVCACVCVNAVNTAAESKSREQRAHEVIRTEIRERESKKAFISETH